MRFAIIPARGGSKRIPQKNIKSFCGKPMIARSIYAAKNSGCFDRIIVSTDNKEIADIARLAGAEVPFMRPDALSDDHTGTVAVVAHAITELALQGAKASQVCCIYATAPLLRPEDIKRGLESLADASNDYAFAVTSYAFPIQRAIKLASSGTVEMFEPEYLETRSQDLEQAFHDAGQFYWGTSKAWLEHKPIFSLNSVAVIIPRHLVQDIDTPEDWRRAELMFQVLQEAEAR
jgi:N-acylneuraminate cytidylyltransferase